MLLQSFALLAVLALACLTTASAQVTCSGAGFDVSSTANVGDMSWTDATARWQYLVRPCGVVTNSNCTALVGFNSTLCQYGPTTHTAHSLATYNDASSTVWLAAQDGTSVTQQFQDGEYCSTIVANREVEFVYVCDAAATTPFLYNVTEVHTCHYTALIHTTAACTHANTPGPEGPVDTEYYSDKCGGGRYNLTSFANGPDLYWDTNSTLSTGFSWFLRPCGTVAHPNCTAAGPAMLCQTNKANALGPHPASIYNDSTAAMTVYRVTNNGIQMIIQDGQTCSTTLNFPRETTVDFQCNATATTAQLLSVTEVEKCYYTAVVQTNMVCPDKLLVGGSSSSSTGSAVGRSSSSTMGSVVGRSSSSSTGGNVVVSSSGGGVMARSSSSSSSTGGGVVGSSTGVVVVGSSSAGGSQPATPGNGAGMVQGSAAAVVAAVLVAIAAALL